MVSKILFHSFQNAFYQRSMLLAFQNHKYGISEKFLNIKFILKNFNLISHIYALILMNRMAQRVIVQFGRE